MASLPRAMRKYSWKTNRLILIRILPREREDCLGTRCAWFDKDEFFIMEGEETINGDSGGWLIRSNLGRH